MCSSPVRGEVYGQAERPAGLRILVPGYPQWLWRQRERALVLFGSYLAAVGVGLFAWGTPAGLAILAFAFATHVISAADAIRQGAFPGFGRWVPVVSASAGLGLGCYAPALALGAVMAWPADRAGAPRERFLVNLWAYQDSSPRTGHWVWFHRPDGAGRGLGQHLAGPGQSVEWFDGHLQVDGLPVSWSPWPGARLPRDLSMSVPQGYALVAPAGGDAGDDALLGMVLVDTRRVLGRAWAQHYPVWSRRLLR
jgi:hypothetical protein